MVCARHVFVALRSAEVTCRLYHKYKHTKSWVVEALWRQQDQASKTITVEVEGLESIEHVKAKI